MKSVTSRSLPESVYPLLPDLLQNVCAHLRERHEKDVFLMGTFPVLAGVFPNAIFRYGDRWHRLNLFVGIVAEAASGKGRMMLARDMGDPLDRMLYARSLAEARAARAARAEAEVNGDDADVERPPFLRLFVAGDTSAAKIKESMYDTPHGVIFESEAKSLSSALSSEWGNFRDVLLKAYMNEAVSVDRKYAYPMLIPHPALSICMSGTPQSFEGILTDVEDGLFSRFMIYHFESRPEWISQFDGGERASLLEAAVERIAELVPSAYTMLSSREAPLILRLSPDSEASIDEAGRLGVEQVRRTSRSLALLSCVRRAAMNAVRISSLLTLLERHHQGVNLAGASQVEVCPRHVRAGLMIAFASLETSFRIADAMAAGSEVLSTRKHVFFARLPEGRFTTRDAVAVAREVSVPRATMYEYLAYFREAGRLLDRGKGDYEKLPAEEMPSITELVENL